MGVHFWLPECEYDANKKKTIGAVAGVGAVQKSFWGVGMAVVGKTTKGGV